MGECDTIIDKLNFMAEYGKHTLEKFEFKNGETLENVEVEYIVKGTPKYDENNNITNAIVISHKFDGNAHRIEDLHELTSTGKPFDYDKYLIITITSLGVPESCSPSTTKLKHEFPIYTIKDKVNFKRQFLKEKLNIEKVLGHVGSGLGGYETFTWACEYPDEMEFIILINSSYKTNGYRYVVSKGLESLVLEAGDYYSDIYSDAMTRIMISLNKILYSHYFSRKKFQEMSNDEIDILIEDFSDETMFRDIYDFKYQNDAILNYNVEDKLSDIKAKTLIITPNDDLYFSYELDVLPLKDLINNCQIERFDLSDDYDDALNFSKLVNILNSFLDNL